MSNTANKSLDTYYYHTIFKGIISFIQQHSAQLIDDQLGFFIRSFEALSFDAQCLLIRMDTRKGVYFRPSGFNYPEINDLQAAIIELASVGFVSSPHEDDEAILRCFKKAELIELFHIPKEFQKIPKDELIAIIAQRPFTHIIIDQTDLVWLPIADELAFLKMLYFGDLHTQVSEIVIQEIGHVKLPNRSIDRYKSWFATSDEARAYFHLNKIYQMIKLVVHQQLLHSSIDVFRDFHWESFRYFDSCTELLNKALYRIGQAAEKEGLLEDAIHFYQRTPLHPSRIRQVKILKKLGKTDEEKALLRVMSQQPINADEWWFAHDHLAKMDKRVSKSTTLRKNEGIVVPIVSSAPNHRPEQQVLIYYEKQGYHGAYVENYFWRCLFGLVFWQEVTEYQGGSFYHPYQRADADLRNANNFRLRKQRLVDQLQNFKTSGELISTLEQTYAQQYGIFNPYINWQNDEMLDIIKTGVERLELSAVKSVLLKISDDIQHNFTGFPDLLVWKDAEYEFLEVKTPNDQLSAQQLFWLDFFQQVGIKSNVALIRYQ